MSNYDGKYYFLAANDCWTMKTGNGSRISYANDCRRLII